MAGYEGRPLVMEMEQEEDFDGHEEGTKSGCGCGWFRVFSLNWWQGHDEEDKGLLDQKGEGGEGWVMNKLKKVKETSEVIAGPKWKNFIRKISVYGKKQHKKFQYDERSYALNFNSGAQSEDEDNIPPSFSTRFSASRQN
ncbi:PREDICTED: uncharacterized protein LOC109361989 [Lupinus angustifolius]|uniref:uncharacterized protein LOC109361989 n=1 Tax=Lupinus angustifolius TaxID=3871 RepID=UPI00092F9B6D|nr:PREDICTED: uncharacterized protein LOC109361989 [Lupinus angustifolius]